MKSAYNQLSAQNRIGCPRDLRAPPDFRSRRRIKSLGYCIWPTKRNVSFAPDELQLIESITQAIGVAAENARLFEQVNQKTAELGQMNQELQEANRAKSEFIAAMSHELRTPLNVIMGNAELTGDSFFGEVNADQKNAMTKIRHHGQFLLKLVNDVLALSRLDAKKMSLELATVNIDEIVTHAQSHVEQLNRLKGLHVCWDVESGASRYCHRSDQTRGNFAESHRQCFQIYSAKGALTCGSETSGNRVVLNFASPIRGSASKPTIWTEFSARLSRSVKLTLENSMA